MLLNTSKLMSSVSVQSIFSSNPYEASTILHDVVNGSIRQALLIRKFLYGLYRWLGYQQCHH